MCACDRMQRARFRCSQCYSRFPPEPMGVCVCVWVPACVRNRKCVMSSMLSALLSLAPHSMYIRAPWCGCICRCGGSDGFLGFACVLQVFCHVNNAHSIVLPLILSPKQIINNEKKEKSKTELWLGWFLVLLLLLFVRMRHFSRNQKGERGEIWVRVRWRMAMRIDGNGM